MMPVKSFDKDTLQDLAWEDYNPDEFQIISDEIVDTSRWSTIYEMVFMEKGTGKYYQTSYSRGATECQDESPYEYEPDQIKLTEVEPVEVMIIQYRPVQED